MDENSLFLLPILLYFSLLQKYYFKNEFSIFYGCFKFLNVYRPQYKMFMNINYCFLDDFV